MTAPKLEKMKFYIVKPQAATNYVTNPTPYRVTTGYTAVGGSIALDDTYSRRGAGCLQVTPTTNASGVYYSTISVTNTYNYTFSVDVLGEAGKAMRIKVEDAGATYTYTTEFTATGYWQRIEVSFTAEETETDYRLYVLRDATTGTTPFYVDGFQFERGTEATTFFSGDTQGFGVAPLEFYWDGTPHASVSYRTKDTRAGGLLVDIEDYAYEIIATAGLGMGNFSQIYTELANGGAYYQKHIRRPRNISLIVHYHGDNPGDLHDNRKEIIDLIRPDNTGYDQPLVIRYQGKNITGNDATQPIDIICIPQYSHESLPDEPINNRDILNFTVLDGHLTGAYKEGAELDYYLELDDADYVVYRGANGVWHEVTNAGSNVTGAVYAIAEAPNGDIYLGGNFTDAGGVGDADYLCKWNGTAIEAVIAGFTGEVYALEFDANGDLYVGGAFSNVGDGDGDHIVKITDLEGTPTLESLGTGANGSISAITIDPATGYVYIGGTFTLAGGIANTSGIAYWDGSAWKAMATGLNSYVSALQFSPDGNLFIGGAFTNADGTNGDYICYWDGSTFNMVGNTELSTVVLALAYDDNGYLYAGGTFLNAGGDANASYIARIRLGAEPSTGANAWEALGTGVNSGVYWIFVDGDDIYVAGGFTIAGGLSLSDKAAVWSNGAWRSLDIDLPGVNSVSSILITSKDEIWIGGEFTGTAIASKTINRVPSSGTANCYPKLTIRGPGVLQSIINASTRRRLIFNGLTLRAGEIIKINLDPYDISMVSSWAGRGSLYKYLTAGSNLSDFYLRPDDNYIALMIPSGYTANTKVWMEWIPKFWSLEGARYE